MEIPLWRSAWALGVGFILLAAGCGPEVAKPPKGPHTIQLHVDGLATKADRDKVLAVLTQYPGVTKAKVDEDGYTAIRVEDGQATSVDALVKAIGDAGYRAHTGGH